jgi:elongation factor P
MQRCFILYTSNSDEIMKIQANTMRPGMVIDHQDKQWTVLKIELLQPGKGGAFIQVEMRDIASGNKSNDRWRTQDSVEKLEVRERDSQYLYQDDDLYTFMDTETFEQFTLSGDDLGEKASFLQEGMAVTTATIEDKPVDINLPQHITLEVAEADAVVKGQTAASSYKPGILENGVKVMIPPFVEAGTRIVINTTDGTYVERAKD